MAVIILLAVTALIAWAGSKAIAAGYRHMNSLQIESGYLGAE